MIYLDIETLDFFQDEHIKVLPRPIQLAAMRFGLGVTYNDQTTKWASYWEGTTPFLAEPADVEA